jgi:TonB-dependent starch-binding outer membrane protein SusC
MMKMNQTLFKKLILPLFILLATLTTALAQKKITGKITDADGGLPGATVAVKGTSTGVVTDVDGNFSIDAPANSTLVISSVGYTTQEITVGNSTVIDVKMEQDNQTLGELVVTGYGTQSKKSITGAVASLDAAQLLTTPSTNIGQAMQGKVAGVTVGNENAPGGGVMVRIRGFGTINDNSPLYVVDGVPTKGNLNTLNLNDVENMQILKDASAASIYGARAGNGVVIITTKRGKKGKPMFSYDTYYGIQQPGKGLDLLNTAQYADLTWQSRKNSGAVAANGNPAHAQFGNGATPVIPDFIFPAGASSSDPRVANNNGVFTNYTSDIDGTDFNKTKWLITKANKEGTNWFDEIFDSAPIQNHQLGVSGGNDNGRYAMSLNYFDQKGIMLYTNYKRYSLRANTEFNVNKRVRIGQNFQMAFGDRVNQPNGNSNESNAVSFAFRIQPIVPVRDVNGLNFGGTRGTDLDNSRNPVGDLYRNKDNHQLETRLFGNAYAEVDILKNLTAKSSFGIDYNIFNFRNYTIRDIESAEARGSNGLTTNNNYEWTWTWYNTLNYTLDIGKNQRLNVLAGIEAIKSYFEFFDASRTNFAIDDLPNRFLSAGTGVQTNNGGASDWRLASEFGKVNYAIADKYLFDATLRHDRSSRFSKAYRSAYFPAVSAGWVLSKESFLDGAKSWMPYAKIRFGWGQTGNQEIGNYNPFSQYSTNPITSFYDLGGTRSTARAGYELTQFGNDKAKWETTTSTNFGFDASFLNNKLDFSLDVYQRRTTDMLFPVEPPLTSGVAIAPFQNIGIMTNKGVDLSLNYNQKAGDFTYSVGGNISYYKNNLEKSNADPKYQYFGINDERVQNFVVSQQGFPISSFFGYTVLGIFQTNEEGAAAPAQFGNAAENKAGRFKFQDTNADGVVNSKDLSIIGNPHPDFSYGLNVNLNYKNFGLALFGQGVQGNQIFNYTKYWTDFPTFAGNRSVRMLTQSWTPGKTDAILPQLKSSDQISIQPSTYYLEDGSYLRLKNIQLTYTLPKELTSKLRLGSARIYVQGQNLVTMTKYSGLDPEINLRAFTAGNDRQIGVDGGAYPSAKQYLMGLNVSF